MTRIQGLFRRQEYESGFLKRGKGSKEIFKNISEPLKYAVRRAQAMLIVNYELLLTLAP